MMRVKFWGVRGSIPCPGPNTQKYGGNGACMELRVGDNDRIIVIDAGSGIRPLGNFLMGNDMPKGPIKMDLFFSHTHWDHIMGFPYFVPIYVPGNEIKVHGPVSYEEDPLKEVIEGQLDIYGPTSRDPITRKEIPLEQLVAGQMQYRYFPINMGQLGATITYDRLRENPDIDLGDGLKVGAKFLNHPVTALGYRFEFEGKVFCTCYDTEPFSNLFIEDPEHEDYDEAMAIEGKMVADEQNALVDQFLQGADFLVHDAQYTDEEYEMRKGWGHSTVEGAIATAQRAGVKKLALFHHDPDRTDKQIDEMTEKYCGSDNTGDVEVFFAKEGTTIEV